MNRHGITTRLNIFLLSVLVMLFCAVSVVPAAVSAAPAESNTANSSADILTVGVPKDRCPVFYKDRETGEITGIGVDLMREAAQAAGYEVKFKFVKEDTLLAAISNDDYDVVMPFGSAVKSVTGQNTIVSENLIQTPFTLVTEGDRDMAELKNIKKMNHLKVGMLKSLGAGAETVKQRFPGIKVELYDTMDDCVDALRGGDIDALLHNSYVWSYVLQKPAYKDLKVQPSAMFSMDFRAASLDSPAGKNIIVRLNRGIAKLTDTKRQAIVLDHTYRQLYKYDFSDYIYEYWLIIILAVLLAIALTVIVMQRLRAVRREHEEKMRYLVDHDQLTDALSLEGFRKRVEELLRLHPDVPYFISYNNIKNFKYINETRGREAADELLRFWVKTSKEFLSDEEAIGRLGADHFVVLRHVAGEETMFADEENVLNKVRYYFVKDGDENIVQLCSGIYVLTPEDYQQINVDRMLDLARVAEKRVRETKNEGFEFYNPEQWEKGRLTANVTAHLPLAIRSGELEVWYQPQVDYRTGKIMGAEALSRWNHPRLGCISPADFIPVLEETGLIFELDSYVWEKVCQDLNRWNRRGEHRSVSVNLSRCDISEDTDIPGHLSDLIKKFELTPDQLRIEITESAYVENADLLIRTTTELRNLGFVVEMDDFGSGYSSLNMLKEVSVDRIKLDLHFLTGTGDPEKGRVIISNIIRMIQSLGIGLIAEGVERLDQAEYLSDLGCYEMQGFYFYEPMPVSEYEKLK